jgi:hypothetical protein
LDGNACHAGASAAILPVKAAAMRSGEALNRALTVAGGRFSPLQLLSAEEEPLALLDADYHHLDR